MPVFKYRVRDRSGKAMIGTINAPTIEMAGNHLYQTGYFPIALKRNQLRPHSTYQTFGKNFKR